MFVCKILRNTENITLQNLRIFYVFLVPAGKVATFTSKFGAKILTSPTLSTNICKFSKAIIIMLGNKN